MQNLATSSHGINLIKRWEGFSANPYLCSAGKLTIGYGHRVKKYEDFSRGITLKQAAELLAKDLRIAEIFINAVLSPAKINGTPLTQNEFDAVACFTFNLGCGALDESTLLKKLQAGDRIGAANQFPRWCNEHVDGKLTYSAGLYKRRIEERNLFVEPINEAF